jgi:predicted ATPase
MLHSLKLVGVGPAEELALDFKPRVNLITGDNGLGKTFLLDVAWWVLGRTWAGAYQALPRRGAKEAKIQYVVDIKRTKKREYASTFDRRSQEWKRSTGRPPSPGLVLYAQADGGFSIWDPARNYWRDAPSLGVSDPTRPDAYHFTQDEVWNGSRHDGRVYCNGLIADWVTWQSARSNAFNHLMTALQVLSEPGEPLRAGQPVRISLDDARDIPTIAFSYGEVPIVHASAGVKRVVALAYLLVWAFEEHVKACELLNRKPELSIIFLVDEIEAHLHPRWQRVVLPAMLDVVNALTPRGATVQILAASHAPLLLASLEPRFDSDQDRIIHFDIRNDKVIIDKSEFAKQGDATNWLVSEFFGLKQARSKEAEEAIEAAEAWMRNDRHVLPATLSTQEKIDRRLRETVPGHDPFWPRWIVNAAPKRGAGSGPKGARAGSKKKNKTSKSRKKATRTTSRSSSKKPTSKKRRASK